MTALEGCAPLNLDSYFERRTFSKKNQRMSNITFQRTLPCTENPSQT